MAISIDYGAQMQGLMNAIDMTCDAAVAATAQIVESTADIIINEQKRLITDKSTKLADAIKKSGIKQAARGKYSVTLGYHSDAVQAVPEGVVIEFGRPGKQRGGIDKLGRKIGKQDAIPHIRAGFDNKKEEACKKACEQLAGVITKTWTSTD